MFLDRLNFHLDNLNDFNKHSGVKWRMHAERKYVSIKIYNNKLGVSVVVFVDAAASTALHTLSIQYSLHKYLRLILSLSIFHVAASFWRVRALNLFISQIFIYISTLKEASGSILISCLGFINYLIFRNIMLHS